MLIHEERHVDCMYSDISLQFLRMFILFIISL